MQLFKIQKKKMDFVNLLIEINTPIDFLSVPIPPPYIPNKGESILSLSSEIILIGLAMYAILFSLITTNYLTVITAYHSTIPSP